MYGVWAYDMINVLKIQKRSPLLFPCRGLVCSPAEKRLGLDFIRIFAYLTEKKTISMKKFRQTGGQTLYLPFLRWLHRFERPAGVPYTVDWTDRI